MSDVQLQTVMFVLAALVIGAVIFGGTTLAYFLGKRRSQTALVSVGRPHQGVDDAGVDHDVRPSRKAA